MFAVLTSAPVGARAGETKGRDSASASWVGLVDREASLPKVGK